MKKEVLDAIQALIEAGVIAPTAPIAKQASKPVAKQASKPVAKQASKPVAKQASKPVAKQASKPVAKQASKPVVSLIDYSDKAYAVIGDTKPIKDIIKANGGRFNNWLSVDGETVPGWLFSKAKNSPEHIMTLIS